MLWMLLFAAQAGGGEIVTGNVHGVSYTRTMVESACGQHVIHVQFRNEWPRGLRGRVDSFRIDGSDVADGAASLQDRAANRTISQIEIMNCGSDRRDPEILGAMYLAGPESTQRGMPANAFFRLRKEAGAWRFSWE